MNERKRRNPERTEARCHQILEAAATCFRQKGFRGASMAEISKTAGMSTGHIYHYFDSKEAIVEAIVHRDQVHGLEIIEKLRFAHDVTEDMLTDSDSIVDRPNKSPAALMLEIYSEAARNPVVAEIVESSVSIVHEKLKDALQRGQELGTVDGSLDLDDLIQILCIIWDGVTIHMALDPNFDPVKLKKAVRLAIERVMCRQS